MNSIESLLEDALKEIDSLRTELARINTANAEMQRKLEQHRQFHDDIPLCYLELDERGYFNEINKAFLTLLGYPKEEVVGRDFEEFLATEEDLAFHRYSYPIFRETGAITNVRWQFKSKNGEINTAIMNSRARYDSLNNFIDGQGILVKISKGSAKKLIDIDVTGELSPRELEVFELIGTGVKTKQIAETLGISAKTVENFRENIKRKLNLSNAQELTSFAIEWVHR